MTNGRLVSRWLFFFKSLLLPFSSLAHMHIKKWNDLTYYFHSQWEYCMLSLSISMTQTVSTAKVQALRPGCHHPPSTGSEKSLWAQCLLSDLHTYCPTLMENVKFYLRLSNISVIPALSASSSILNLASSWSSFLKCRSTCFKEDQR